MAAKSLVSCGYGHGYSVREVVEWEWEKNLPKVCPGRTLVQSSRLNQLLMDA